MNQHSGNSALIAEGTNGKNVKYHERLLPGIYVWLLITFMTISLGIAYGYVYGRSFGIILGGLSTGLTFLFTYKTSPIIQIDDLVVQVGNARIPIKYVGTPKLLDQQQTVASRRAHTHRDAYLVLRAAIEESVLFEVTDLEDPHPYWHFSSRQPNQVVEILKEINN